MLWHILKNIFVCSSDVYTPLNIFVYSKDFFKGVYVSLSTGSGFIVPSLNYGHGAGGWRVNLHPRHVVDVNGDGKADIVGFGNAGTYLSLSQA